MASRPLIARLISAVSNCATSASVKQSLSSISTSIWMLLPTSGPISCATFSTCAADVKHLRLQRLAAGEGQQLRGELGGTLDRFGDRIDIAASALFGEIAPAQEIGRGANDGQQIVEVVRDAAGELADRFHLLRLTQHFLALAAFGDVDGLGHGARHRAVPGRIAGASRSRNRDRRSEECSNMSMRTSSPRKTFAKASRTRWAMPSVSANHGVSQNGLADHAVCLPSGCRRAPSCWHRAVRR